MYYCSTTSTTAAVLCVPDMKRMQIRETQARRAACSYLSKCRLLIIWLDNPSPAVLDADQGDAIVTKLEEQSCWNATYWSVKGQIHHKTWHTAITRVRCILGSVNCLFLAVLNVVCWHWTHCYCLWPRRTNDLRFWEFSDNIMRSTSGYWLIRHVTGLIFSDKKIRCSLVKLQLTDSSHKRQTALLRQNINI